MMRVAIAKYEEKYTITWYNRLIYENFMATVFVVQSKVNPRAQKVNTRIRMSTCVDSGLWRCDCELRLRVKSHVCIAINTAVTYSSNNAVFKKTMSLPCVHTIYITTCVHMYTETRDVHLFELLRRTRNRYARIGRSRYVEHEPGEPPIIGYISSFF